MKKLLTLPEAAFSGISGAKPSGACRNSARAPEPEAQANSQNPVVLALQGPDQPRPESDPYAKDRLRIANEIMQQLGWAIEKAPRSNGDSAQARPKRSEEQVKQTCVELQAYLDLFAEEKKRQATQPQQQRHPVNGPGLRNPVLAALAGSHI